MNRIVQHTIARSAKHWLKPSRVFSDLRTGNLPPSNKLLQRQCRSNPLNAGTRNFSSSFYKRDDRSMEEEAERKIGWLLKLIFAGTATLVAYNLFPYLGENLMQQAVQLLYVKDPLFKRMGASRLARFAIDDAQRMKIVEMGGAKELVNMLGAAKDDKTRKEALKALVAISKSDEAVVALHEVGAISVIKAIPSSLEYPINDEYKLNLLKRFEDLKFYNNSKLSQDIQLID